MVFLPHWPKFLGNRPSSLGLDRIRQLLAKLDNPQDKIQNIIHIAGTNGKGSIIAFLKAILEAARLKVNVYTSPHLLSFNERIVVCGSQINDEELFRVMEECRVKAENLELSFFEATTAGAFLAFSRSNADVTLLETGLGGRLDATNVVTNPILTIITPISIDHTEYLGPDIRLIAREKLGILKMNVPCISSLQQDEVNNIIIEECHKTNSRLFAFSYDYTVDKDEENQQILFKSILGNLTLPLPNLFGDHQIINAATAIAVSKSIGIFSIDDTHIETGITNAKWPGRMQKVLPLAFGMSDEWQIWLDGAHNVAAAYNLANIIDGFKKQDNKKIYLILGMTKGRNIEDFLLPFKGKIDFVCACLVQTEPSAYKSAVIADKAVSLGFESKAFDDIVDSITYLKQNKEPGRVIICGSLYLVSDALKVISK